MDSLVSFFVSLLLGFLIGIEREKATAPGDAMGVRTFTLLALLGSIAGWSEALWLGIALATFALGLVLIAYFRASESKSGDRGLTTEVAAGIVFALGYAAHGAPAQVALLSCAVALLLFWKDPLHRFSEKVRPRELEAALLILLFGISVLIAVEDKVIDPWGLFNPRKFGIVVLLVAGIEFLSYVAVKLIGPSKGAVVSGFLGGLASSTAVVLTATTAGRAKPAWRQWAALATVSIVASILELTVVVGVVAVDLLARLALGGAGALATGVFAAYWLLRKGKRVEQSLMLRSPLDIFGVLRLSLLLAGILAFVALAQRYAGDIGRDLAAFLAGTFELHGVSLAVATMRARDQLETGPALRTIEIAILASLSAKIAIVGILGRHAFRWALCGILFAMGISVFAANRLLSVLLPIQ